MGPVCLIRSNIALRWVSWSPETFISHQQPWKWLPVQFMRHLYMRGMALQSPLGAPALEKVLRPLYGGLKDDFRSSCLCITCDTSVDARPLLLEPADRTVLAECHWTSLSQLCATCTPEISDSMLGLFRYAPGVQHSDVHVSVKGQAQPLRCGSSTRACTTFLTEAGLVLL